MVEQCCVRTYEFESKYNCAQLNSALKEGWKVVMVTPKPGYNEYILEKEFADKHAEYNFPKVEVANEGGSRNGQ